MSLLGIQTAQIMRSTLETKEAVDATRSSGLHYFITTLLLEKAASVLDAFTTTSLIKSDCFILKHARFIERHLSVDEFFAPSSSTDEQHNFPYCHYTETYETPDGKHIVVYVCINKEGKVEHCKIKSVQTMKDAEGKPIEVVNYFSDEFVSQVKSLAIKNADVALKLIKKLNVQKLDKFLSLHKEVQDLDCELSRLSQNLHKKKARADYLRLGKKFIENIKILNNLTDSRYADTRDAHIKRICARIEAGEFNPKTFESYKAVEATSEVDAETELTVDPASKETDPAASAQKLQNSKNKFKSQINAQRAELLAMVQKDKVQLDRFPKEEMIDTKQLIERAKIVDNLRCTLLALYCLPDNPQKELQFIEALEKELEKISTLLQSFETRAKSGKVSEVAELYLHIESNLSASFIRELIEAVLYDTKNNLNERIAVCDYLNQHSPLYCVVIEIFNSTFIVENCTDFSPLGIAHHINNPLAFEMLLRQGANPNEAALIRGKFIVPMIYVALGKFNNDLYYVEKLLKYGSYLEFPNNYFDYLDVVPFLRTILKPNKSVLASR